MNSLHPSSQSSQDPTTTDHGNVQRPVPANIILTEGACNSRLQVIPLKSRTDANTSISIHTVLFSSLTLCFVFREFVILGSQAISTYATSTVQVFTNTNVPTSHFHSHFQTSAERTYRYLPPRRLYYYEEVNLEFTSELADYFQSNKLELGQQCDWDSRPFLDAMDSYLTTYDINKRKNEKNEKRREDRKLAKRHSPSPMCQR